MRFTLAILTLGLFAAFVSNMQAAQIVVRSSSEISGPIVRLGDVADITSTDAQEKYRLESVELFPVPSKGQKRYVKQRELQDLLMLAGVSLARHRFSGATSVTVYGELEKTSRKGPAPITSSSGRRAKSKAERAILDYVKEGSGPKKPEPWIVEVALDDAQIRTLLEPGTRATVVEADDLKLGTCRFLIELRAFNRNSKQVEVDAQLSLPDSVVAAKRRLRRGTILQAADLTLIYDTPSARRVEGFYSMRDVIGKELTQAVGEGDVIPVDYVSSPIIVRKREVVTVVSRAAGIAVSTNARAKESGSMGELIPVESLESREVYFAKVTGLRELEVMAGMVKVEAEPTTAVRPYNQYQNAPRSYSKPYARPPRHASIPNYQTSAYRR
ncbi:MAG: flagellar basal body P-ring formation chaperone FlgA [Planctomycetia bacterium]|jgi:flagella basal body P-ring formation protein FlgA